MQIAIGCDDAGLILKEIIIEHLRALGHDPVDLRRKFAKEG